MKIVSWVIKYNPQCLATLLPQPPPPPTPPPPLRPLLFSEYRTWAS